MRQDELVRVFQMIDIDYPNNPIAKDQEERKQFVARWLQRLGQYDAKQVYAAYETHVSRSPTFAPNWQHLAEIIVESSQNMQSAHEAWGVVLQAVKSFGHTMPKEAERFCGPDIWRVVNQMTWGYFCEMETAKESTYFAQFRDAYNSTTRNEYERARLPQAVREALESGQLKLEAPHG